ncbi:conserved hypothetical protein [Mucor ambiguus]|uniref:DDE Tnp4 domain-containing protein n=1 Tax=Mucor ambiguus TaxID=91626 RepID=A0A0C9LQU1_9FUNG|nr:conserved hypothetical protein [Mucor ambiguus]
MPKTSLRKSAIKQLKERVHNNVEDARFLIETLTAINAINEVDERDNNMSVDTEELEQLLHDGIKADPNYKKLEELEHHRYLLPRDHYKQRNYDDDVALINEFMQDKSEGEFRRIIRMSKRGFLALHEEIKDDEIFISKSGPPQRSVKFQMAVALTRFGIYGNSATNKMIGDYFNIGHGSVDNYVQHFIAAVLKLQHKYIQWPMGSEREKVIRRHHELFGLPKCIGFMDGSLFGINQTPTWHSELFWCHYGSANDPGVLNASGLLEQLSTYFEDEQYVVADSAYAKTKWCVPIGRASAQESLTGSDVKFNHLLSRARVSIENCFGALKGRFASLQELRNQLKVEEDVDRHSRWIVACFVLHNFCLQHDDPAFMKDIIDFFYKTHDRGDHFETEENMFSKASRSSKYGNFGDTDGSFIVPNISMSEGIEKWLALKKYVLNINRYDIDILDALYEN